MPVADARFDGFGDELDAMDTSDSWDEQLAMQEAWLAAQKKKQGEAADPEPEPDGLSVDEEALSASVLELPRGGRVTLATERVMALEGVFSGLRAGGACGPGR